METPLSPDEWAHIALTYDGSAKAKGVKFYLNGKHAQSQILLDRLQRHITNKRGLRTGNMIHLDETIDQWLSPPG